MSRREGDLGKAHVVPSNAGHIATPFCWCLPWEDPADSGLWIHREARDEMPGALYRSEVDDARDEVAA